LAQLTGNDYDQSRADSNYFSRLYNGSSEESRIEGITILDSTLREGEQSVGVSFTKRQRLQIAWMLDYFGVEFIEASPVISESHFDSVKEMKKAGFSAKIISHGRALTGDIDMSLACDVDWIAMYHWTR
jgi:2-isopropylmalate synthase